MPAKKSDDPKVTPEKEETPTEETSETKTPEAVETKTPETKEKSPKKAPKKGKKSKETDPFDASEPMQLTSVELQMLGGYKQKTSQLVSQIGSLEVQKSRMIGAVAATESEVQELLELVQTRLGIPMGIAWRVQPNGEVTIDGTPVKPKKK